MIFIQNLFLQVQQKFHLFQLKDTILEASPFMSMKVSMMNQNAVAFIKRFSKEFGQKKCTNILI